MMNRKIISSLSDQDKSSLRLLKALIIEYPQNRYTINQLAKKAGISRIKLTYGFKLLFGSGIHQFIITKRIEKAQGLLHSTDLPIKAIASQCGYKTTQHFITAFKKYTGQSPGLYRKSN